MGALKEFFEHSNVGDFKGRIELVQVFLKNMEFNGVDKGIYFLSVNVLQELFQKLKSIKSSTEDHCLPTINDVIFINYTKDTYSNRHTYWPSADKLQTHPPTYLNGLNLLCHFFCSVQPEVDLITNYQESTNLLHLSA